VRNAAPLIRVCLLHHLALGMERILVLDNGSSDATPAILRRLERRTPITVLRDDGPFRHSEFMTRLMHEASGLGADWIVPFDDDEFLVSDTPLAHRLGLVQREGILIPVVNFVQHRSQRRDTPRALLSMVRRPERSVDAGRAAELAEAGEIAAIEAEWPRKLILRSGLDVTIERGSHGADGIGELELADWCRFLHAPLRSPAALARWADQGRRHRLTDSRKVGWQHWMMAEAEAAGRLDEQWRLNSWDGDGTVGPRGTGLVSDTTLADAVRPWVRSRPAQLAARLARRSF
jgi:glycosyltransferase involved in cell wall biosynthesis